MAIVLAYAEAHRITDSPSLSHLRRHPSKNKAPLYFVQRNNKWTDYDDPAAVYVIVIRAGAQSAALIDHARIHGTGSAEKRKRKEEKREWIVQ